MSRAALVFVTLVAVLLGGCTLELGKLPEVGAGDACRDTLVATKARWDVCEAEGRGTIVYERDTVGYDRAWANCDNAVSGTLRPVSGQAEQDCLVAISQISCDKLDQRQPRVCDDLFLGWR